MKTALFLNELPDDLAPVIDKLLVSLATAHNPAQLQRERDIQQGFFLGLEAARCVRPSQAEALKLMFEYVTAARLKDWLAHDAFAEPGVKA